MVKRWWVMNHLSHVRIKLNPECLFLFHLNAPCHPALWCPTCARQTVVTMFNMICWPKIIRKPSVFISQDSLPPPALCLWWREGNLRRLRVLMRLFRFALTFEKGSAANGGTHGGWRYSRTNPLFNHFWGNCLGRPHPKSVRLILRASMNIIFLKCALM